ncbi:grasp-with-spasm system SPASM domain peptide maturase [Parabacteroides johnsonii]|uniref:grasp-with-spasm system SPASM domain peptide maturase n=1 Tax=Parabacteroides johnsonii TaxID=387661 RepID=UPI003AB33B4A
MLIDCNKDRYFMIYADCFLTKGVNRSSILDVTNGKLYLINADYNDIIDLLPMYRIGDIIDYIDNDDVVNFNEFIVEMIRIGIGCFVDDPSCFPKIKEEWDSPSNILDAVVDIREIFHDFGKIIIQLNSLRCKFLQIRSYRLLSKEELYKIVSHIKGSSILYVEIVLKYDECFIKTVFDFVEKYTFLNFILHSSPKYLLAEKKNNRISFIPYSINSSNDCGRIIKRNFSNITIESYMENLLYNSCLNRKISVDEFGMIKNCPSMVDDYGNISDTSLVDVCKMERFKRMWYIKKTDIKICNMCEYRCVCSDCRAFISDKNDLYSKPLKCKYNPYK